LKTSPRFSAHASGFVCQVSASLNLNAFGQDQEQSEPAPKAAAAGYIIYGHQLLLGAAAPNRRLGRVACSENRKSGWKKLNY